jgi:hypothetical protein
MTDDRRIPVDVDAAVKAVIQEADRLEALGDEELARSGTMSMLLTSRINK